MEEAQKKVNLGENLLPWIIEQLWASGYKLPEGKILDLIKFLDIKNKEREIIGYFTEILSPETRIQLEEKLNKNEIGFLCFSIFFLCFSPSSL